MLRIRLCVDDHLGVVVEDHGVLVMVRGNAVASRCFVAGLRVLACQHVAQAYHSFLPILLHHPLLLQRPIHRTKRRLSPYTLLRCLLLHDL